MGREEQIEERGVLDSIYPDEITGEFFFLRYGLSTIVLTLASDISETSYRVSIALDVPGRDEEVEPRSLPAPSSLSTCILLEQKESQKGRKKLTSPPHTSIPHPHSRLPPLLPRHRPAPRHHLSPLRPPNAPSLPPRRQTPPPLLPRRHHHRMHRPGHDIHPYQRVERQRGANNRGALGSSAGGNG